MRTYAIGIIVIPLLALIASFAMVVTADSMPRESCECRELKAIRRILEQQFQVVCDERRCLPVPTPTVSDGGSLP
jgi:hypothetical protein